MADSKITGLIQDTSPSLTDLIPTVKDPGGTPLSRKVTIGDALKLMQGNVIYLRNNDGVAHYAGTVVIVDTSIDNGCKKTTSSGDPKIIGVAAETVSAGASGKYYQVGQATVLVQGNVSRGTWIIASTTSGRAAQYGYLKPTSGGIGIALTGYAGGGAGTVTALISIQLSSTVNLQPLATVTKGSVTTLAHTTDAGTDLLVVRTGTVNAVTTLAFNGTGLTKVIEAADTNHFSGIWYLQYPSIGSYNIVMTGGGGTQQMIATNYAGSKAGAPFRTGVSVVHNGAGTTTDTLTPTSALLDIVIDAMKTSAVWNINAGQTAEESAGNFEASYKAGAAGTTTVSYTGASTVRGAYSSAAIAGS